MDRIAAALYAFGSTLFDLRCCCTLRQRFAVTVIVIVIEMNQSESS